MENYAKTHQVYSLVKVLQAYDFVLQTFLETWKHQSNFSQFTPEINTVLTPVTCTFGINPEVKKTHFERGKL